MSGELPPGWVEARFSEVATIASDLVDPREMPDSIHLAPDNIESWTSRISNLQTIGEAGVTSPKHRFSSDQIVYSKIRPYLAKAVIPGFDGLCSADMYPINVHINPKYLLRYMLTKDFVSQTTSHEGRTVLPKINQEGLNQTIIPLPPLPEQHRIVERIEALLAKGAKAKAALDILPALVDRYRQSLLAAAFRGDLTAASIDGNLRSEPDELGERPGWLPVYWGWTTFGELASVTGGLTKNSKRNDLPIERPYLRVANVYADELRLDDIQTIQLSDAELNRVLLQPDDLLIVEGNGSIDQVGRVARWTGEVPDCVHQNHIIKARPRETWRSEYLLLWLLSPQGRVYIERQASSSSGLHTLSLSKIMRLPVPILTRQEAMLLVARVRQGLESIDTLSRRFLTATCQHTTLTQSILAKAFRGELVPQDPMDEPASVLLARIRNAPKPSTRPPAPVVRREKTLKVIAMAKTRASVSADHLTQILKMESSGTMNAEKLFKASGMDIDEFYKQLSQEMLLNMLRIGPEKDLIEVIP